MREEEEDEAVCLLLVRWRWKDDEGKGGWKAWRGSRRRQRARHRREGPSAGRGSRIAVGEGITGKALMFQWRRSGARGILWVTGGRGSFLQVATAVGGERAGRESTTGPRRDGKDKGRNRQGHEGNAGGLCRSVDEVWCLCEWEVWLGGKAERQNASSGF